MAAEEMNVDSGGALGLFDEEDEEDNSQQQQQQQQQETDSSKGTSWGPFSSASAADTAAAAAALEESLPPFTASAATPQQQEQPEQQQQQQQQEEEVIDRSAVLQQCGGCPCHLLVFEELEARGLSPHFELLHLMVLAASKPAPPWQQQQLQQQQQHQELLQPMEYSWGLAEPQQVRLNLSMLRFALDCMQSIKEAGVGCTGRVSFLSAFFAFRRLRRQRRRQQTSSRQIFVLNAYTQVPDFSFEEAKQVTQQQQQRQEVCR
ncbi:hypothetical protein Efla_007688 [Eimeria flavescens]